MKHTKGNKYKSVNLLIVDNETDKALYFREILKKVNQHAEMYEALKELIDNYNDVEYSRAQVLEQIGHLDSLLKEITK